MTQGWARKEYRFSLGENKTGWDIVQDKRDYDLSPWILKGKLRWLQGGTLGQPGASSANVSFRGFAWNGPGTNPH